MKRRSILAFVAIPVAGLLALPTLSSWIARDFLQQTMRVEGDFEGVSIDPINGKLVLKNLVLGNESSVCDRLDESSTIARPINSVATIWANFSLQQLLYRRFDSSLIVMDGIEIGHCDKSIMMLPEFKPNLELKSTKQLQQLTTDSSSKLINDPAFQISLKTALDQVRNRSSVSRQHLQSEFDRLQRDAKLLALKPLDTQNPLRSELEAKRIRAELDRIAGELKSLTAILERDIERTKDSGPAARDKILVDWMTWNNARLAEVDEIDIEGHVRMMLSVYASECIKPIVPALVTTHAISRWSMGESSAAGNSAGDKADDIKRLKQFDLLLNPKDQSPFAFRNVKLRGRTLVGSEPLAFTGTVKKLIVSNRDSASLTSNPSTQTELAFTDTSMPPSTSVSVPFTPLVASASYSPAAQTQTINLVHHDLRMVNQVESPLQFSEEDIRSKIRSANPKSELVWSMKGDRWECSFKSYGSDIQIDVVALQQSGQPVAQKPNPKAINLNVNNDSSFNLYRSKSHGLATGTPFLQVTYTGKLEGERLDNCIETIDCASIAAITQSVRDYLKQKTDKELVAMKERWVRHAGEQIASWQKSQESELYNVRRGIQDFEKEIAAQQSQIAKALSDSSDERFARKNLQDKSGTITR